MGCQKNKYECCHRMREQILFMIHLNASNIDPEQQLGG